MNRVIVISLLLLIFTEKNVIAMPWAKHLAAWEAMQFVPLDYGGLEGKLDILKLTSIHTHMDGNGSGPSKRNTEFHDPIKVADWFSDKGFHKQAVFNAAVIHVILDMADPGPTGVNGHEATPKNRKIAEEAYERIMKGERFKIPKFAKSVGPLATRLKSLVKIGGRVVEKIATKITYVIIVYEGGKIIYDYSTGTEIQTKRLVESGTSIVAGFAGATAGSAVGSVACLPLIETPIGYGVCIVGFAVGGAALADYIAGNVVEMYFADEGKDRVIDIPPPTDQVPNITIQVEEIEEPVSEEGYSVSFIFIMLIILSTVILFILSYIKAYLKYWWKSITTKETITPPSILEGFNFMKN